MWLLATAKKSIPTDFQLDEIYDCVHDASKKETPHPRMAQDMLDIAAQLMNQEVLFSMSLLFKIDFWCSSIV